MPGAMKDGGRGHSVMAGEGTRRISVDGREIGITHADRIYFPRTGLSKGDLVDYYVRIAPIALRHFRDRALTMHRFPDGIAGEGFYQKHLPAHFPDWIDRIEVAKEGGTVVHVVANDAATLAYLANFGCVTPHLSLARRGAMECPDQLVFDLDPSDEDFAKVQFAAARVRDLCGELGVRSFVKTTGSRGLHVIVPLDATASFDAVRPLAREMARSLAERFPDRLTVEHRKAKRGQRVFIDYLRNAYGQTAVAPYAVRAIEGAPVATPLDWSEALAGGMTARRYTLGNIFRRLGQKDDPWRAIQRETYSAAKLRRRFDGLR